MRYSFLMLALFLTIGGCSEKEEFTDADIDVPLNCTIPGELELENNSKNLLKKYERRLEDDLNPKALPTNPKKFNLD